MKIASGAGAAGFDHHGAEVEKSKTRCLAERVAEPNSGI